MAATNSTPLKPFTALMDASVAAYRQHFKSIALLTGIVFLAWLPLQFMPQDMQPILRIVGSILYTVLSIVVGVAILKLVDENQADKQLSTLLRFGLAKFFPVLLTSILAALAAFGGFLLLIVPGFIFAIWFVFVQQVVVFEDKRYASALKQSRRYVRGRWWGVLGRLVLLTILILLASILALAITAPIYLINPIVPVILSNAVSALVISPIGTIFTYYLYRSAVETYSA